MPFIVFSSGRNTLSCCIDYCHVRHRPATAQPQEIAMSHRLTFPLVSLLFVTGCTGPMRQGTPDTIAVQSDPAGAHVMVMGKDLGVTPLTLPVKAVFPASYTPEQEALYGRVTLLKDGCAEYVATVDNRALGRGLKAQLDCAAVTSVPAAPAAQAAETPAPAAARAPAQRLRMLDDVHKEGLISDEEYRQLRQRILDEL
jgi:hypothetical protein